MKKLAITLGVIQCIVAVGAIPAGWIMIFEPDGTGIGIPIVMLDKTPFHDFFFPGLFLFVINGLGQLIGAIFSFRKNKHAGVIGIVLGILLLAWIIVQVYFTGWIFFLQHFFFAIALIEIMIAAIIHPKTNSG